MSRALEELVGTAAAISAGAIITLDEHSDDVPEALQVVPDLIRFIAETLCARGAPSEDDLVRLDRYLTRLTRRYGTMHGVIDAISVGRRRHALISTECATAWSQCMAVSSSAVEMTMKRHTTLQHAVQKWLGTHVAFSDGAKAYQTWLDGELEGFDDQGESRPMEPRLRRVAPLNVPSIPIHDGSSKSTRSEPAPPRVQPAIVPMVEPKSASSIRPALRRHGNEDVEFLWRTVFEDKRPLEAPGERQLSDKQLLAIERLRASQEPFERAVASCAARDFGLADSFLPHLDGRVDSELLAMLRGHRYDLEGRFDEALEQFQSASPDDDDPAAQRALAIALLRARKGSTRARFGDSIRLLRAMYENLPEESLDGARGAALLGFALMHAPIGDRTDNVDQSVICFERALEVLTRTEHGPWWAETNHYLAVALLEVRGEKRNHAVERAVECLEDALKVWTRDSDPGHWAAVQTSLGMALERRPAGERADNLMRAIEAFSAALAVRTRESHAVAWARLQSHLADAWMQFPSGDLRQNIERAIAGYAAAAEVWARESRRADWASVKHRLGVAWATVPTGDDAERQRNLREAVTCLTSALEVRTRAAMPLEWGLTQHQLGVTLLHGAQKGDAAPVKQAIACLKAALVVRTRDRQPVLWARTMAALGEALAWMATGAPDKFLSKAIEAHRQALAVLTEQTHPVEYQPIAGRLESLLQASADAPVPGLRDD